MEEILSKKPINQLAIADSQVTTYVLLLEKVLEGCIAMGNINKSIETKSQDLQKQLVLIKLQNKNYIELEKWYKKELNNFKTKNKNLDKKNRELKTQVLKLQSEKKELEENKTGNETSTATNGYQKKTHTANDDDPTAKCVLVKGFAPQQLNSIFKINIINIARLMNMHLMDRDIVKVSKLERKYYQRSNRNPDTIILIVQFSTVELKIEFLKNKDKVKLNTHFTGVEINDYVSEEVYNLYQYAKILKLCGYAHIYWRNNCVYVKKTSSSLCEPILIKTRKDVDALKISKKY